MKRTIRKRRKDGIVQRYRVGRRIKRRRFIVHPRISQVYFEDDNQYLGYSPSEIDSFKDRVKSIIQKNPRIKEKLKKSVKNVGIDVGWRNINGYLRPSESTIYIPFHPERSDTDLKNTLEHESRHAAHLLKLGKDKFNQTSYNEGAYLPRSNDDYGRIYASKELGWDYKRPTEVLAYQRQGNNLFREVMSFFDEGQKKALADFISELKKAPSLKTMKDKWVGDDL